MKIYTLGATDYIVRDSKNTAAATAAKTSTIAGINFNHVHTFGLALPGAAAPGASVLMSASNQAVAGTNPWDVAHNIRVQTGVDFVEPDLLQKLDYSDATGAQFMGATDRCTQNLGYDPYWPLPSPADVLWHLQDGYSQLGSAKKTWDDATNVYIGHLDTGYDPNHSMVPTRVMRGLERNFSNDGGDPNSATDPDTTGLLDNPYHGTGTMSILAGKKFPFNSNTTQDFELGGAPGAHIVPVRISPTVVLLKTSAFVTALDYVMNLPQTDPSYPQMVDIVTMSMGGLASSEWARAVNDAYMKGIFMTTASGDNINGLPTKHLIYPSRFNRVVAAVGATSDRTPYFKANEPLKTMNGNFGPDSAMQYALAAYAPNVAWAKGGCANPNTLELQGAGTSSATPQIAAAAAHYLNKFKNAMTGYLGWQKVEAIRYALFKTAVGSTSPDFNSYSFFGKGMLKANDALSIAPDLTKLTPAPADSVSFPLFRVLFGLSAAPQNGEEEMYQLEILQLLQQHQELEQIMGSNTSFLDLSKDDKKKFLDFIISSNDASNALKTYLTANYDKIIND